VPFAKLLAQKSTDVGITFARNTMNLELEFGTALCYTPTFAINGITGPEYELVAGQLEVGLSFGSCGWCV